MASVPPASHVSAAARTIPTSASPHTRAGASSIPAARIDTAMDGVLFIDEAYYLYRPENERDYGQESIEILLQVMENQRDDLVVILAGYADRMDRFFASNPGFGPLPCSQ